MTLEQLTEMAVKSYFKRDPELRLIYATADGNFFFQEQAKHGRNYAAKLNQELLLIENPKFAEPKEEEKKPSKKRRTTKKTEK
jgi:hypothetical protein